MTDPPPTNMYGSTETDSRTARMAEALAKLDDVTRDIRRACKHQDQVLIRIRREAITDLESAVLELKDAFRLNDTATP